MRYLQVQVLVLALFAPGVQADDAIGQLRISVAPARVEIDQLAAGRQLILLPSLEFAMRIEADCGSEHLAESLSIGVADTRLTIDQQALAETAIIEESLRVPRRQVPPMGIQDYCMDNADDPGDSNSSTLLINDAMTAQLSLKCANNDGQSVLYRSIPLAIELSCQPDSAPQPVESSGTDRY